jgi:dipeptidyl aminopeptidase/acylaminoacyl peptidase
MTQPLPPCFALSNGRSESRDFCIHASVLDAMMRLLPWLFLFALLWAIAPAHAERDIVYAARYYTPPGSHRTSHFHLYRINPDGTGRTQLTYGNEDDTDPHWSPDGRRIVFLRGEATVCVANANGRDLQNLVAFDANNYVTDLRWLPDGRSITFIHDHETQDQDESALWLLDVTTRRVHHWANVSDYAVSSDGHFLFLNGLKGEKIVDRRTRHSQTLSPPVESAAWLNGDTLVGIISKPSDTVVKMTILNVTRRTRRNVVCRWPHSHTDLFSNSIDAGGRTLEPYSRSSHFIVYVQDVGDSGTRPANDYWFADTRTGRMTEITNGQCLVWSPQGSRYCTAFMRDMTNYGPIIDGYQKSLYTSPLVVGSLQTRKEREIVAGLVWVTGADWRKRQ